MPMLFAWAIWHGVFLGSYNYLHTLLSAEYFGRMHIGAIRGAWLMPASVMRASGPLVLGVMHNVRGSYLLPFVFAWGIWGVMTAALASASASRSAASSGLPAAWAWYKRVAMKRAPASG